MPAAVVVVAAHLPYKPMSVRFRFILVGVLLLCCSVVVLAQPSATLANEDALPVNQRDANGRKQGLWYFSTPARMGESGTVTFGNFIDGKRNGVWYKLEKFTENPISIETYKDGMLHGEAQYFEEGKLYCIGNYRAYNPQQSFDTFVIVDPVSQLERYKAVENESGAMRQGYWRYYDIETGHLIREEEYTAGELLYQKKFTITADTTSSPQNLPRYPHDKSGRYIPPVGKRSFTK